MRTLREEEDNNNEEESFVSTSTTQQRKRFLPMIFVVVTLFYFYLTTDIEEIYTGVSTNMRVPFISMTRKKKKQEIEIEIEIPKKFYTHMRTDRSGAAISDMIYAKAFAFHHNSTYVGVCNDNNANPNRIKTHKELLESLGIDHVFPFICPTEKEETENDDEDIMIIEREMYFKRQQEYFTPEFFEYLQSLQIIKNDDHDQRTPSSFSSSSKVVLHIRRGDVTPCMGGASKRYIPNQYYLDVLEKYKILENYNADQVTVLSESKSYAENFSEFSSFDLELDGDLNSAWKAMASAEVFIMSTSSFSYIPALFNNNTVIFNPRYKNIKDKNDRPVKPSWKIVDQYILDTRFEELERLQKKMNCTR